MESAGRSPAPVLDAAVPPPQPVSRVAAISTSAGQYRGISQAVAPNLQPILWREGRTFPRDPKYIVRLTMEANPSVTPLRKRKCLPGPIFHLQLAFRKGP